MGRTRFRTRDDRVALILLDHTSRSCLNVSGHARILKGDVGRAWIEQLRGPGREDATARVYVIRVQAFDWNCLQHIAPRFTEGQTGEALAPFERRSEELERENVKLRDQ